MSKLRLWGLTAAILGALIGGGCKNAPPSEKPAPEARRTAEIGPVELPWIEDDFAGALKSGAESNRLVVVDMWAAWCHTCLSMKQTVLRDPAILKRADNFVWAAIDTENPKNANALAALNVEVWPTFFILAPSDASVIALQLGATSVQGFEEFLQAGSSQPADGALATGNYEQAITGYRALLQSQETKEVPKTLLSLITALARADRHQECLDLAKSQIERVAPARNALVADFIYWGNDCAEKSKSSDSDMKAFRMKALGILDATLENVEAALSADDRSEALRIARKFSLALGKETRANEYAKEHLAVIETAVTEAKTPMEELTFAYPRYEIYSYLNRAAELIPWFEKLTQELPNQYDPPYRLAGVLAKLERFQEARAAAETALKRSSGARKSSIWALIAKIELGTGNREAAIAAQQKAIEILRTLPDTARNQKSIVRAREELATIKNISTPSGEP